MMARFSIGIICLLGMAITFALAPDLINPDYADNPVVGAAIIFLMVLAAPVLLLSSETAAMLFPVAFVVIVILGWRVFVRREILAAKMLFIVWIWSGFIGLGAMIAANPAS